MIIMYSSTELRCCCVVWASATIVAARLTHRTDYCAFLLEWREPHFVPNPCGHSCMVCPTVSLTVMPSYSDITDVSNICQSFRTNNRRTLLFHVARYKDDIICRKLNLDENCPVVSGVSNQQPFEPWTEVDKDSQHLNQLGYRCL